MAESADPLGDLIHRLSELGVLRLEHEMQRVEHGPGDVPMVVVGLQIERVAVGQEAGETVGYGSAAAVIDSNVNGHGGWPFCKFAHALENHDGKQDKRQFAPTRSQPNLE